MRKMYSTVDWELKTCQKDVDLEQGNKNIPIDNTYQFSNISAHNETFLSILHFVF